MNKVRFVLSWHDYYNAEQFLWRQQEIFSIPLIRRMRLKRRWDREPLLRAEHAVQFSTEGIHYVLDDIESNLDWNYYKAWAESPDGFLLISFEDVFNYIPKRAISDEAQQSQLRTLLTSQLRHNLTASH